MAGIKISELTETTSILDTDVMPVINNSETKKVQWGNAAKLLQPKTDTFSSGTKTVVSAINTNISNIGNLGNAIGMRGWNQLSANTLQTTTSNGITCTNNGDGSFTLNGTATALAVFYFGNSGTLFNHEHTYLLRGNIAGGSSNTYRLDVCGNQSTVGITDTGNGVIQKISSSTFDTMKIGCCYLVYSGVTLSNAKVYPQVFDLTETFGSGNEPSTVDEFRAMYSANYYPYHSNTNSMADLNYTVVSTWT